MIIDGELLVFTVLNNKVHELGWNDQKREGKGLELLRKRLTLAYDKKADFTIHQDDYQFKAILKIPIK